MATASTGEHLSKTSRGSRTKPFRRRLFSILIRLAVVVDLHCFEAFTALRRLYLGVPRLVDSFHLLLVASNQHRSHLFGRHVGQYENLSLRR